MQSSDSDDESHPSQANTIGNVQQAQPSFQPPQANPFAQPTMFVHQAPQDPLLKVRSSDLTKFVRGKRDLWQILAVVG